MKDANQDGKEENYCPFKFGKFHKIKKYTKASLRSKEYKDKEYKSIIEGNKMLMEEAYTLEVFKHNAKKVTRIISKFLGFNLSDTRSSIVSSIECPSEKYELIWACVNNI
ncbi:32857_t:CDS:2 [Gigaspora margarita]|uniref:32857_t:CDS:1 n=1 Tax=Gigaspora margarita TaxID=4874 RepID=A0ABM8W4L9_GIGMA|nr:32857_t:CDS:2 [Gigaspora margarita]